MDTTRNARGIEVWASKVGWTFLSRDLVLAQLKSMDVSPVKVEATATIMDRVASIVGDEQAAGMAGVMFASNDFTVSQEQHDDWS